MNKNELMSFWGEDHNPMIKCDCCNDDFQVEFDDEICESSKGELICKACYTVLRLQDEGPKTEGYLKKDLDDIQYEHSTFLQNLGSFIDTDNIHDGQSAIDNLTLIIADIEKKIENIKNK